jgi:ribosomal protection tetracycline resistance protein
MTDSGYASPVTTAADFRRLTQLVLSAALDRGGTWVCEPLANLALEIPSASGPGVAAALGRLGGRIRGQYSADGLSRIQAALPVARLRELQDRMSALTGGEGLLEASFGGYQPVGDHPPRRPRTTPNPLNREEFLMELARRG